MSQITLSDIRSIPEFMTVRDDMRARVIALKKHRRVFLGDKVALLFENRETMVWQIHEMMRAEGITKPAALEHECETYSALLPTQSELSATMFIEMAQGANIRAELDRLIGIDECTALYVGDERVAAKFDPSQLTEERISAVHYLRFPLSGPQREAFLSRNTPVRLVIEHEAYTAEFSLEGETRRSLSEDLAAPE
jgi:hypothetical protein